ncbi:hypothetical protein [Burkholderia gladioli]|uniref:hypothetical protein n=1 Tax=Burkholderia gladioli TaxID=28095 RepID=UPI001C2557C2|nr:hypothetical protein [Burkholderia gladioli]MBU9380548.1 hypothetical protein [Burkholderia gladioli]
MSRRPDFRLHIPFVNGAVYIIDAMGGAGRWMEEELLDINYTKPHGRAIVRFQVDDGGDLRIALSKVEEAARQGCAPIIHFECHGHPQLGLQLGNTMFSWSSLEPMLRRINVACGGNLGIVMAVCYGLLAITPVHITRPTPFLFLIGSEGEIKQGRLKDELPNFYRTMFSTGSLEKALSCLPSCRPFHAEILLAVSFGKFLRRTGFGRRRREHIEERITLGRYLLGGNVDEDTLRRVRAEAKAATSLVARKAMFADISDYFLVGRSPSFTFESLVSWVRLTE